MTVKFFNEYGFREFVRAKTIALEDAIKNIPENILLSPKLEDTIAEIRRNYFIDFPIINFEPNFIDFDKKRTAGGNIRQHAVYEFSYTGDSELLLVRGSVRTSDAYVSGELEKRINKFRLYVPSEGFTTEQIKAKVKQVTNLLSTQLQGLRNDLATLNNELENHMGRIIENKVASARRLQDRRDELGRKD